MVEVSSQDSIQAENLWGFSYQIAICKQCDGRFLFAPEQGLTHCPFCGPVELQPLAGSEPLHNPELCLPFHVEQVLIAQRLREFTEGLWFPPGDLSPNQLKARLQPVFFPVWLVDGQVQAHWEAEAGFNYDVVSHQDRYDDAQGGWRSREITEQRVRWEPRLGRLNRAYHNISAPALEKHKALIDRLGAYRYKEAVSYQSRFVVGEFKQGRVLVLLPDRSSVDAWPDALPAYQAAAAEECRQAIGADHVRSFRWSAQFDAQNWTLLLLPAYTTYYLDDDHNPQMVFLNAQTGRLWGTRRSSMRRARNASLWLGAAAFLCFFLFIVLAGISAIVPPLMSLAGIGLFVALGFGLAALVPLLIAWTNNRHPNEFCRDG